MTAPDDDWEELARVAFAVWVEAGQDPTYPRRLEWRDISRAQQERWVSTARAAATLDRKRQRERLGEALMAESAIWDQHAKAQDSAYFVNRFNAKFNAFRDAALFVLTGQPLPMALLKKP